MRLAEWIAGFKELHQKAKQGALAGDEARAYEAARDELARAFLAVQRVQTKPGQSPRQAMRVSRALQVVLERGGESTRALTLDLSAGGFGALVAGHPAVGEKLKATLRIPGGEPVTGTARVVGFVPQAGASRVAFALEGLAPADAEKLELVVFDTVLDQLRLEPEKKK